MATLLSQQEEMALFAKAQKWAKHNGKRFSKQQGGATSGPTAVQKEEMPAEHVRKIIRDHGDMSSKKFRHDK